METNYPASYFPFTQETAQLDVKDMTIHNINVLFSSLSMFQFDFLLGLIGFFMIRHTLPSLILQKDLDVKTGVVLALCFALFGSFRSYLLQIKKNTDSIQA